MALLHEREQTASVPVAVAPQDGARRVLVVIDSARAAETIKDWIAASLQRLAGVELVLLAAMPEPEIVRTRALFADTVRRQLRDDGASLLMPLHVMLDEAGIACTDVVSLADDAASIVATAGERGCDQIIMTAAPQSRSRKQWLSLTGMGASVAAQVVVLAECPVLVIKHGWR